MTRAVEVEVRRNSRDSTFWEFDVSGDLGPESVRHIIEVLDLVRSCRGRVGVVRYDRLSFADAATRHAFMRALRAFRSGRAELSTGEPSGAIGHALARTGLLQSSREPLNVG